MPKPENIIPHKFKKGQSGNPKGRPKLPDLREALAEQLDISKIITAMQSRAMRGDVQAAKFLFSYGYGNPDQKIKHEGDVINPTTIIQIIPDTGCEPIKD